MCGRRKHFENNDFSFPLLLSAHMIFTLVAQRNAYVSGNVRINKDRIQRERGWKLVFCLFVCLFWAVWQKKYLPNPLKTTKNMDK